MQDVYEFFGEKGMAFLALEGTDVDMKAASETLHRSTTFLTPTLSALRLEAASRKMSNRPDLFEGLTRVHAAYKDSWYDPQHLTLITTNVSVVYSINPLFRT